MTTTDLDLGSLERFLKASHPDLLEGRLTVHELVGGKSNLTYRVSDGTRSVVLRRPPRGPLPPTAHDMSREFRVLASLHGTRVPVPRPIDYCPDPDVLGAPFYLMEYVAGASFRTRDSIVERGPRRTATISSGMVDALSALHSIDPHEVGLGDFGRPGGFLRRQLARWHRQLEAIDAGPGVRGEAEQLHRSLSETIGDDHRTTIVHGDYRLDNLLVDQGDRVVAVLDWEMATLGDPLTDLALLVVYRDLGQYDDTPDSADVGSAPGFLSGSEIVDHYQLAAGDDLPDLAPYLGLAYFKLAVIYAGIRHRERSGQAAPGAVPVADIAEPLLAAGRAALSGDR